MVCYEFQGFYCYARYLRARTWPSARDDRVSCIQGFYSLSLSKILLLTWITSHGSCIFEKIEKIRHDGELAQFACSLCPLNMT